MVFDAYGYAGAFEAGHAEAFGECRLCTSGVRKDGAEVQVLNCIQCRVPIAVPREHYTPADIPDRVRALAEGALISHAEAARLSGTYDDSVDSGSLSDHWRAHWRGLGDGIERFPQDLANAMTEAAQEAVLWFHDRGHVFLGDPGVRIVPDKEVRERIRGMQYTMDKEVFQTVAHAGSITHVINPETMEGYDEFLRWYAEYERHLPAEPAGRTWYNYARRYDLSAMPFERQRALVERWERLHASYLKAHPELDYTFEHGYLRRPYRIFSSPLRIIAADGFNDLTYGEGAE